MEEKVRKPSSSLFLKFIVSPHSFGERTGRRKDFSQQLFAWTVGR
jgi:hypothetical protein